MKTTITTTVTALTALLFPLISAWDLTLYDDGACKTAPKSHFTGPGDADYACTRVHVPNLLALMVDNMGTCRLDRYATLYDCISDFIPVQTLDGNDDGTCVNLGPAGGATWGAFKVECR